MVIHKGIFPLSAKKMIFKSMRISLKQVLIPICLGILICLGLYLRLNNLGYYSLFASDDAVTTLCIKNIIKNGYSALPSGLFYLQELLYSYPTAWLCRIFGMNEFTLRIFNLPFSLGVIILVYLVGKEFFTKWVGLLSAAILTFSTWELEFTRYVRSYILVQFLFLLCIYLFWKVFVRDESISKILLFMLFFLTVFASLLGTVLITVFLSLWIIKGRNFFKLNSLAFVLSFIMATFILLQIWAYFADAFVISYSGKTYSFFRLIEKITLPKFDVFMHLILQYPVIWYLGLLICLTAIFFLRPWQRNLLPIILIILMLFDLLLLGLLIFWIYTLTSNCKKEDFRQKHIVTSLVILTGGFLFWLLYGLLFWKGVSYRQLVDLKLLYEVSRHLNLFNFPSLVYYLYFFIPLPRMSLIVAIGLCLLYIKVIMQENRQKAIYFSSLFVGAILYMPFPNQHSLPRYNIPLYPIFVLIYSFAIIEIAIWLSGSVKFKLIHLSKKSISISLIGIFLLFTLEHTSYLEAYHVVNVAYGEPVIHPYLITSPSVTHYLDYKSAGEYVLAHMDKDDIVIAQERVVQYFYINKVDYYLYLIFGDEFSITKEELIEKDGPYSDVYTKAGTIYTLGAFKEVINKNVRKGKTIWAVVHNYSRLRTPQRKLVAHLTNAYSNLYNFLKDNHRNLVFIAKDNITEVYRFTPYSSIK